MKRSYSLGVVLAAGVAVGAFGSRTLSAQDPLKMGTVLDRVELATAKGTDALLVLREVPPGGQSGKHTQSGTEVLYVLEGSVVLEVEGKAPVTLKAGEASHTSAGEVHNVKNASASAPCKALVFYVAKKGAALEDLSLPVK